MATNSSNFDDIGVLASRTNGRKLFSGAQPLRARLEQMVKTCLRYFATYYRE